MQISCVNFIFSIFWGKRGLSGSTELAERPVEGRWLSGSTELAERPDETTFPQNIEKTPLVRIRQ
jgi:hypothetical protein